MTAMAIFFIVFGIAAAGAVTGLIMGKDSGLLGGESYVFGRDIDYVPETPEERYRSPDRMLDELNRLGGSKSAGALEPQKKKLLMGLAAAAVCVAVLLLLFVQANPTSAPM